ncbi:MAG: C10 family peptidase [Candidatus Aminicenantes bacterium]|nr:C10 family peptidase [Candidatus Aminicenantes bacterium]
MNLNKTKSLVSFPLVAVALAAALVLLFAVGTLEARLVGQTEAWTAAARLLEIENGRPDLRLTQGAFELDWVEPLLYHNRPVAYLIRLKPQGFMILSDITEVSPQVFVSYEGDPEQLTRHPFLIQILNRLEYNKVHLSYLAADVPEDIGPEAGEVPDPVQVKRNEYRWSELAGEGISDADRVAESQAAAAVGPLLTSKWNQDTPFWNNTPTVGGQHTYTGCSATAMAQVMYYWKYPLRGQGSHSYQWNGTTLSANFNHEYLWTQMLASYSGDYTAAQAAAVARLMSDVGISIDMNYGVDASGSVPNANDAFTAFFKYSSDAHWVERADAGSWAAWFNIIRQQMDVYRPVVLAVFKPDSGHAVVADGYRTSPSNQVHINMGWGGYADNYYSVDNIYEYGDTQKDYAVVGIHPPVQVNSKLTIQPSAWGTTTPTAGVHYYPLNTDVQVTAFPAQYATFVNWTGDASGTDNPVTVKMTRDKTIKADIRYISPPSNLTGSKDLNRSFSQAEYIDTLSWQANTSNEGLSIATYKIYTVSGSTYTLLTEVNADQSQYSRRNAGSSANQYAITAVTSGGREGAPALVTIQ